MPPRRQRGSFEAIWFLVALEESYCLLSALEYGLGDGDVMCAWPAARVSPCSHKPGTGRAGVQPHSHEDVAAAQHPLCPKIQFFMGFLPLFSWHMSRVPVSGQGHCREEFLPERCWTWGLPAQSDTLSRVCRSPAAPGFAAGTGNNSGCRRFDIRAEHPLRP